MAFKIKDNRSEKDLIIKNILVENEVIENIRVAKCGQWFNKINKYSKNKKKLPIRFFCMRWDCRMCRRILLFKLKKKHEVHNNTFAKKGGKIILIKLMIPHSNQYIKNNSYTNLKRSIVNLKESRGWNKIKELTHAHFHFDNLEIRFIDNEFHMCSFINYGIYNNKITLYTIEELLSHYWRKSTELMGFSKTSVKSVKLTWLTNHNHQLNKEKEYESINFCNDMELRDKMPGTLENLELLYLKVKNQTNTNLNSFNYIKKKELNNIGTIIKDLNAMQLHSKRGRIWIYKK